MYPAYGVHTPEMLPPSYGQAGFLDHISTQMAISQAARRFSRGSGGQRPGPAMRVVKPKSASNSPGSSSVQSRRRTMMGDGFAPRRQQQQHHNNVDYISMPTDTEMDSAHRTTSRPLSWHPSTYIHQRQQPYQQPTSYPFPGSSIYADSHDLYSTHAQFSPTMASYSNNTSPSSSFSPLPLFPAAENGAQYPRSDGWELSQRTTPFYGPPTGNAGMPESLPALEHVSTHPKTTVNGGLDWNSFVLQGFNNTSPPTPETFPQATLSQPAVSERPETCQGLDEDEDEGEILVGMGLYDTPEKFDEDPQLNNYRSTVSSLLGSTYRPQEPRGKGLKLEETWEPPKSDDGEDEDDEDEDDDSEGQNRKVAA
ncbi:hypothetical protein PCL_00662 [Purpureocillium lilacinum]|uniref:Uncharacterized protein n=1 Tax=Purpureocillium lilacinum TaxID=33203 RepID=A0A2U3E5F5_PURLI|nr:hypothetical protein Purlil1_10942 [Purpureocillium lilacinum]PWI69750.1 hypothetical protein PCL_00662 [Purpureocillium lilacinum]